MSILGLGNPMLDISIVTDTMFLKKHSLEPNGAKHVKNKEVFMDIESGIFKKQYLAGGSIDNTCRVAKRLLGDEISVHYIGCIGNDTNGLILQKSMKAAGVNTYYQISKEFPTGRCAVIITNREDRSLVTYPGAANQYAIEHLEEHWDVIQNSNIIYSGGFFLASSSSSLFKVAKLCSETDDKLFCFNLSAAFLCRPPHVERAKEIIQYADIVIGNQEEAETFAEFGLGLTKDASTDHELIANAISKIPKADRFRKSRSVIITRGKSACIVLNENKEGAVQSFPTSSLKEKDIVDTNGAGDAFVGGLLAGIALNLRNGLRLTDDSISLGLKASSEILKVVGCNDSILQRIETND